MAPYRLLSSRCAAGREVWRPGKGKEKRKHNFRVYKELMFGEVWGPACWSTLLRHRR